LQITRLDINITTDKNGNPVDLTVKMPMEPVALFGGPMEMKKWKKKYGAEFQDIIKFCQNWIDEGDKLIKIHIASKSVEFRTLTGV